MSNNAQSGHPGYEQSSSDIRAMLPVFCTNGQIPSGYCSVSSNFSFSIRAGHGAKGDPWRNYMGKGKLEIGGMVIRISVQYRDSAECNIATDQAKLLHFSAPAFANVRLLLQIKNSWIPTVSVPKLLFCILWACHPKSFWDTLSQNYIKCFRHYSRWVFVSLNWDFFPVLTQISGRARDWRSTCHWQIFLSSINLVIFIDSSLCSFVRTWSWPWPRVSPPSVTAPWCEHLLCYGPS